MNPAADSSFTSIMYVVVGGLATDLIATGFNTFDKETFDKELQTGGTLSVGPGGKSCNIARMIASLAGRDCVGMVARTCEDQLDLWRVPIDALNSVGVNTQFVRVVPLAEAGGKFPQVAMILVGPDGKNRIYVMRGINDGLPLDVILGAKPLFDAAEANKGMLALSLEMPSMAAMASIAMAGEHGIKVLVDPGGIDDKTDRFFLRQLLEQRIYLIKPNCDEASILTSAVDTPGVTVKDVDSARVAAQKILQFGNINYVLITDRAQGGYLFGAGLERHIPVPPCDVGPQTDGTGCGDRVLATLCYALQSRKPIEEATRLAILAGTMQFYRPGIIPVTKEELGVAAVQAGLQI